MKSSENSSLHGERREEKTRRRRAEHRGRRSFIEAKGSNLLSPKTLAPDRPFEHVMEGEPVVKKGCRTSRWLGEDLLKVQGLRVLPFDSSERDNLLIKPAAWSSELWQGLVRVC